MKQQKITEQDVENFVSWCQGYLPHFEIRYKDESKSQHLIDKLIKPINKTYMTQYTTVLFGKVYFPSRKIVEGWGSETTYKILRHEFVHLMDAKRFPVWFELSYLFLFPAFLTMRAYWEMRGYTQSLLVEYELTGEISEATCSFIHNRFVNSEYGWMWGFSKHMQKWIERIRQDILAQEIKGPYPYTAWGKQPLQL